jgi:hypothetical protein
LPHVSLTGPQETFCSSQLSGQQPIAHPLNTQMPQGIGHLPQFEA